MSPSKTLYSSGNPFERRFGYARAVRKGPFITVAGTTALKIEAKEQSEGETAGSKTVLFPTDAHQQASLAMRRCVEAIEKLGGRREDVIRVRMFVAKHEDGDAVGRAFREAFGVDLTENGGSTGVVRGDMGATATMLFGNGFVDPDILVEVEVDGICSEGFAGDA